jgi:ribosome-associated protein
VDQFNTHSRQLAQLMTYAALEKKALRPLILQLPNRQSIADYFVIVSGKTEVQVHAIYLEIVRVCKEQNIRILHQEGEQADQWILLDLGNVIIHIFREPKRQFYDLEQIWHDAKIITLPTL